MVGKANLVAGYSVIGLVEKHVDDWPKFLFDELIYRTRAIITRGLYTFYPLFEVHLFTVTFGLMYG